MAAAEPLHLYQEATLLALRDHRGTTEPGVWAVQATGAGLLADLLLGGRVALDGPRSLVTAMEDATPVGDSVLDGALARVVGAVRRDRVQRWVGRFSTARVFRSAAERLCEIGVLRTRSESVLLVFSRKVYPEIDPRPEREIVDRLGEAIFGDRAEIDARTSVLISIASATGLLAAQFSKNDLRARRHRVEAIKAGEAVGAAAAELIEGIQAALIVACVVPAAVAAS